MGRIEKTVFISYRRTNLPWALAIYQNLKNEGYDVFFDYLSIPSGDFENIIIENIRGRAHFVVILTPSAVERCNESGDWLRREIETAIDEKRNIVPLMLEGFDFGSPVITKVLTGKLERLKRYNGLRIHSEYFFEGMHRLRNQYLNASLDAVTHPISESAKPVVEEHQTAADNAPPVEEKQLIAQTWFERGVVFAENNSFDEAIRCYTKAISIRSDFAEAYISRGAAYGEKMDLDSAIADFNKGIHLQPNSPRA
jgi:tetratricopeptide (TPR) repeat protein